MKIKLVVIDLEIPAPVKKWGIRIGIPAATLLVGGGIAWAAGLHVWATGDSLAAADLNANFSNLQGQITTTTYGTRVPSAFKVTGAVNVPSSAGTKLVFGDAADYNLGAEYSSTTGLFTAANAGIYEVACQLTFTSVAAGHDFGTNIYKGGTNVAGDNYHSAESGAAISALTAATLVLAKGDTLQCAGYQDTGSTLTSVDAGNFVGGSFFTATRIY